MKISIATPLYSPDTGGPATDTLLLETLLPKHGIVVSVCTFGAVRHLPRFVRHVIYFFMILVKAKESDCVVALDTFSVCVPAALAAALLRKPLVVRVPGDYAWEQAVQRFGVTDTISEFQKKRYGWRVGLFRFFQTQAVKSAVLVVTPSDFLRKIVLGWGVAPGRLIRIYLGVELTNKAVVPQNAPSGKVIFSLGRLVPWKGFSMLINLMRNMPKEWSLVIAGDGPLRRTLEQQAEHVGVEDRVNFLGAIPQAEVFGWLTCADVFVLNTHQETFSFQIVEAMAHGAAIVTTNVCSTPELITDGVEGVLCTPDDESCFKTAILSTESEPNTWEKRRTHAQQKASLFTAEKSVQAFAEALEKICE